MVKARRIKGIDCDATAVAGIRQVLSERFEEMSSFRDVALKWKDPEGVHSMRVASRRLRSAVRDFMPYLNKRSLSVIQKEIRVIAAALGEVRDQDVAISALEKLSSKTPTEFVPTLKQLIEIRKDLRKTARDDLKQAILKSRLRELHNKLQAALEFPATSNNKQSTETYSSIARTVIQNRLAELEKLSNSLYHPLNEKPLHEMRIAAKRLRYAIELFGDCWGSKLQSFAKHTARLQTDLGKLHDCDVWLESFSKGISQSKRSGNRVESESFVWLFIHFNELRNQHYREAFKRWGDWRADQLSDKLREAIGAT